MKLQHVADNVYQEIIELDPDTELTPWLMENIQDITVTTDYLNNPGTVEGYSVYLSGYMNPVRIETSDCNIEVLDGVTNVYIHAIPEELNNRIIDIVENEITTI